ncbi:hypothetical protein [Candidatus Formimonas warabiya]|uniref:Uncharacterized protein n=1 Tax=Formimonas warabiya TaxID=1761012 RepID=A0A3G1KUJ7_FORW1|nr:hypothetical protein [Candidatus Formimonas warabiya]ATW26116.1 hypothetical protein DCMF_16250 [Candidatus Formimonas warabiya]
MGNRIGRCFFFGFILGFFMAVVLNQWIWLAMRTNISLVIPACSFLAVIWAFFPKRPVHRFVFYGAEILFLAVFLVIYRDPAAFAIMPAIMLKEAFFLSFLSLSQANGLLLILLATGNILWFLPGKPGRNGSLRKEDIYA